MDVETEKIVEMIVETKGILDDFMKHLLNIERRLKRIENQIS